MIFDVCIARTTPGGTLAYETFDWHENGPVSKGTVASRVLDWALRLGFDVWEVSVH